MKETPLQRETNAVKLQLHEAKGRLTRREWATLIAILAFFCESEYPRRERDEVA